MWSYDKPADVPLEDAGCVTVGTNGHGPDAVLYPVAGAEDSEACGYQCGAGSAGEIVRNSAPSTPEPPGSAAVDQPDPKLDG